VISESAIMIAKAFPPQEQAAVMQSFTKYLDAEKVRSVMVASMAQRFTVEEIQATRKFLGSPTGKSITGKLRAYLGDIMPTIETATADATGKVLLEMRRKSRQPAAGQK
jgi:hypothetical protein